MPACRPHSTVQFLVFLLMPLTQYAASEANANAHSLPLKIQTSINLAFRKPASETAPARNDVGDQAKKGSDADQSTTFICWLANLMLRKIRKRHLSLPLLLAPITVLAVMLLAPTQANIQQDEGPPEIQITEERLSGYKDFDCDQISKELTAVAERYEYEATPKMTDGTMFFGGNIGYIIAIKELVKTANGKSCGNRSFDCSDYVQTCNDLIRDGFDALQSGDFAIGLREIRPLAEHGISPAQFAMGICYEFGNGVAVDQTAAADWYRRAADQGHPTAQRNLGNMYFNGWGVPQDMDKAVDWYEKAAAQGNISAQFNIGYVYAAVKEDYVAALEWWLKSANAGYPPAMSNLGVLYRDGLGTAQDTIQAYMWFYLAAELADQQAEHWRNELASSMSAEQIAEAEKLVREWKEKVETTSPL